MRKILLATVLCVTLGAQAQWNEDQPVRLWGQDVNYPDYLMRTSDTGYTWLLSNKIDIASNGEPSELFYAQGLDKDGKKLLGETPYLLSDEYYQTYIMIEDNLFIDRDNNGLFGVLDHRYDEEGTYITFYKISPEGEMLWGTDGITINMDYAPLYVVGLCGIQLEDGSYVFAWMAESENNSNYEIVMQRVSEDGQLAWEPNTVKLSSASTNYQYPHLQNAGNNQYLLSYAYGSSGAIQVMKYDFDGTPVWTDPASVYNGSWGSTPLWIKISYAPSGDGGMIISWYADPNFTNIEDAYIQYVKPDGTLGFNAKNGLQLDYTDNLRHLGVKTVYDPSTDSFLSIILGCDPNQYEYCVKAQRISKSGDLLWGEEGKDIVELGEDILGFVSVQLGNPGEVAYFYESASDAMGRVVSNNVSCYDIAKCEELWSTTIGDLESPKGSYYSGNAGTFWVVAWHENGENEDGYSTSIGDIYTMRVNFDGTQGVISGISPIATDNKLTYNCTDGNVEFATPVSVYDINGRLVGKGRRVTLEPGLYIAADECGNKVKIKL